MYSLSKVRCRGIILHDAKLLTVKNSRGSDFYALPGGHLDPGESPLECIERELYEELGVRAKVGRLLYVYTFVDREGVPSTEFLFHIENGETFLNHEDNERSHAHELSEVRWIGKNDELRVLPIEIHTDFKNDQLFQDTTRYVKG